MSFLIRQISVVLLCCLAGASTVSANPLPIVPGPPSVDALHYALLDPMSGEILAQYHANQPAPPASLTKLVTAYLTFNALASGRLSMTQRVPVSVAAWKAGGSTMFLQPNLPVTVNQLIDGMVVVSGNDAAITLADAVTGDTSSFVQMMNATAKQLGMTHSRFSNVNGLPPAINVVSAHDIAILAEDIERRFPQYLHYFAQKTFTYNHITQRNWNPLVFTDPTVTGLKTGHTKEAGYCLVATATRDGRPLIAVVMGSSSRADSAQAAESLLDYGYRFFETREAYKARQVIVTTRDNRANPANIPIGVASNTWVTVPIRHYKGLKRTVDLSSNFKLPLKAGETVGKLMFTDNGKEEKEVPLVALKPVKKANLILQAWNHIVATAHSL